MAKKGAVKVHGENGTVGEGARRLAQLGMSRKSRRQARLQRRDEEIAKIAEEYKHKMEVFLGDGCALDDAKHKLVEEVRTQIRLEPAFASLFMAGISLFCHKTGIKLSGF